MLRIIQDSAEQRPFIFSPAVLVEIAPLSCGDYSIKGLEHDVAVERKEAGDLMNCLKGGDAGERKRFVAELRTMRSYRFAFLIVELTWPRILAHDYRSEIHHNSVIGSLVSFAARYGIPPILCDTHEIGGVITEALLRNIARIVREDANSIDKAEEEEECFDDGDAGRGRRRIAKRAAQTSEATGLTFAAGAVLGQRYASAKGLMDGGKR